MFFVILVLFSGRIPVCIGGILASQTIIGSCLAMLGPVLIFFKIHWYPSSLIKYSLQPVGTTRDRLLRGSPPESYVMIEYIGLLVFQPNLASPSGELVLAGYTGVTSHEIGFLERFLVTQVNLRSI